MNRRQVAQRLGKSQATVRRIEGVLLHPTQDSRGVHRFDDKEVEALAHGVENGTITLWQELRRGSTDAANDDPPVDFGSGKACTACADLEQQVQALRNELDELRRRHRRDLEDLRAEHSRERAQQDAEASELAIQVADLLATLED